MTRQEKEAEAKRMAREGYGHEDLAKRLGLNEFYARYLVFGFEHAKRWLERNPWAMGKAS